MLTKTRKIIKPSKVSEPDVFENPKAFVERYMEQVLDGSIPAARLVIQAVKRQKYDLKTGKDRGLKFNEDAAKRPIMFSQYLRHWKGEWGPANGRKGQVFKPSPWQAFIDWCIFGWQRKDNTRRFRSAYIEVPRKCGKALALDTKIPTPDGWITMEKIKVGDIVFDEKGKQCNVVGITPVMENRPCFEVGFSDGFSIVADEEHEWVTDARIDRDRLKGREGKTQGPKPSVKTTKQIFETLVVDREANRRKNVIEYNHRIPISNPIECEAEELVIPPYALGVWLGDGTSSNSNLTYGKTDCEIVQHLQESGISVTKGCENKTGTCVAAAMYFNGHVVYRGSPNQFRTVLGEKSLLGNKHIPDEYLRASVTQRMELLQGLMDTDGYCAKDGQCEFTTTSRKLRFGMMELLRTLGFKPGLSISFATLHGRRIGKKYRIRFHSDPSRPVFKLKRKKARQVVIKSSSRSQCRQIVSVEPVKSVPVRCIQVDSPSHLYLAGEGMVPTHNSFWISKNGLYLLIADGEPASEVVSFATKKEQARIIAENVAAFINASETLKGKFVISGGRYVNNISYAKTASKLEPIGADSKTADGLNVSAGLGDELHEHPSSAMWDVIETAMGARRQPLLLGITTAGADSDSFCGQLHDYAEKLLLDFDLDNGIKNDSFFAFVSAAEKTDDWTSPEVWAKANPNYGISVKPDVLADACQKAKSIPSARNAFLRKHLNIWTQQIEAWIPIEMWDKCEDRTFNSSRLIGQPCWGGLDLSSKLDLTAFVLLFAPSEETGNKYRILPFFWIPEDTAAERERLDRIPYQEWIDQGLIFATPGNVVDYATVESKIVELSKTYQLKDVGFDLWNAEATSQRLREIHGIETFEFRQGMASMNEPCKEYEKIIASKELRHDGNAVMRWMVGNVSIKTDEAGNIRPIKPQGPMSRKRVDGVVATVMALGRAILKPNDTDFDFRIV